MSSEESLTQAPVVHRIDELLGNTPMVLLSRVGDPEGAPIYLKMENGNPGGSIRDRYVAEIIERAVAAGMLIEGDTVALAGLDDSAVSAALTGASLGIKTRIFAPKGASPRLFELIERYGAQIEWTAREEGIAGAIEIAASWTRRSSDRLFVDGYRREAVRDAYGGMAAEILQALRGKPLGAFITSVTTGATFRNVARELREARPSLNMGGAILGDLSLPEFSEHQFNQLQRFTLEEAFRLRDEVARKEGLLLGPKGAVCVGLALEMQTEMDPREVIVALNPDSGQRYLGWEEKLKEKNE